MSKFLIFFSLLLNKNAVNPPEEEGFVKSEQDYVEINNTGYTVYYKSNYEDFEYFSKYIDASNNKFSKFIKIKKLKVKDCKPNKKLIVNHISLAKLNDRSQFYAWQTYADHKEIWGLYDSKNSDVEGWLYLTNHSEYQNFILTAHEVSHYWYDRLCLHEVYPGDTEQFAMEFQNKLEKSEL